MEILFCRILSFLRNEFSITDICLGAHFKKFK